MAAARTSSRASAGSRRSRGVVAGVLVAASLVGWGAVGGASGASAGASTAAPVASPAATSLSVRTSRMLVPDGGRSVVRGVLRAGTKVLADQPVTLLARTGTERRWRVSGERTTSPRGRVAFLVRPHAHTAYRLGYPGSSAFEATTSRRVDIDVRPRVTLVAEPPEVEPGESTLVEGVVEHGGGPVAGARATLVARADGPGARWSAVRTATTAADGAVSFAVTPEGTTRYRLRVAEAAGLPSGRSRAVEVRVRAPDTGYGRSYAAGGASRTAAGTAPTRAGPIR